MSESLVRLIAIMGRLRDPDHGCPWDQKQTYASIVPHTLEEAYEVADAIQRGDLGDLRDELGDLLFQIVFYSQIAREEGAFDFDDVAAAISDKMIRRHPHVFGDVEYADDHTLHAAWEGHKAAERAQRGADSSSGAESAPSQLDGIARALPALIRAEKLQKRAARVGFDWPDVGGALAKVEEEFAEVNREWGDGDPDRLQDELGDLLFALVNVLRLRGLDAEQTLSRANEKFERRFRAVEGLLRTQGSDDLSRLTLAELDAAWEAVKRQEREPGPGPGV